MTTQIATFIPLQPQNSVWGANSINQGQGWNTWYQNSQLGNHGQNPHSAALLITPTVGYSYENGISELAQGGFPNCATVAYVPQQGRISASGFVPAPAGFQNLSAGAPVIGLPAGNQGLGSICGSFATELSENNQEYVVSVDVPGIEICDLDISLAGNTILINGIRKGSQEASSCAYSEIARGSISRAIAVPCDLSPSKAINTSLENGVLKIRIAKETQSERKTTSRKVKIG